MCQYSLSVIVTSYNYEKYIYKTIESLVNQTEKMFEIIIIDDGSTDNSVKIINQFCSKYNNIKFIQHYDKKNHGLAASVVRAVNFAEGTYIAFCESDDFWDKKHVEFLLNCIKSKQPDIIFNELITINTSHNKEYDKYVLYSNNFLKEHSGKNIFRYLYTNPMPTFSSSCVRKDILMKCNYNSTIAPYLDFWLWRQICIDSNIYYLEGCKTYWRKHDESYDMRNHIKNINRFLIDSNNLLLQKINISYIQKLKLLVNFLWMSKRKFIRYQMDIIQKNKNL